MTELKDLTPEAKAILAISATREQIQASQAFAERFSYNTTLLGLIAGYIANQDDEEGADIVTEAMIKMAAHEASREAESET
jgi:hypothetical protein